MDDKDNLSPFEKAFLNPMISELLLSFLSLHDILKLRRINWFFKKFADPIIEERKCSVDFVYLARLKFDDTKHISEYSKFELEDFIKILASYEWYCPFHSYEMTYMQAYGTYLDELDEKLYYKISKTAKQLTFLLYGPDNNWFWRTANKYPCLETLIFKTNRDFGASKPFTNLDGFSKIIGGSPNLEKLVLKLEDTTNAQDDLLLRFLFRLKNTQVSHIKHLELTAVFNNDHWNALSEMGFQLTTLTISFLDIAYGSHDWKKIPKFLESQSETLENLEINFRQLKQYLKITFPEMKKVEELRINFEAQCKDINFPGLCYATQFPNLKKLFLQGEYRKIFNVEWYLTERMKTCASVQYLELPALSNVVMALKIFPNVKDLRCATIDMNSLDALRSINNLEKWTLYKHRDSEQALEYFMKGKVGNSWLPRTEKFGKNLKYMKFVQIKMTDELAQMMINMAKDLQCLDLRECDKAAISAQCLKEMRKKVKVYIQRKCIQC